MAENVSAEVDTCDDIQQFVNDEIATRATGWEIGAVFIHLIKPNSNASEWLSVTVAPRHHTENTGLDAKKDDDLHVEQLTAVYIPGNTWYYHRPGCSWKCV